MNEKSTCLTYDGCEIPGKMDMLGKLSSAHQNSFLVSVLVRHSSHKHNKHRLTSHIHLKIKHDHLP